MPFRMSDNQKLPRLDWKKRGFSVGRHILEECGVLFERKIHE